MRQTTILGIHHLGVGFTRHFNKRFFFAVLIGFFTINITAEQASASLSFEQQTPFNDTLMVNEVRFDNIQSFVRNDSLYIAFDLVLQDSILNASDALHIEPVYNTVTTEIRLPKIIINGKERSVYYHREQILVSQKEKLTNKPYFVLERNNKKTQHIAYDYVMPFKNGLCKVGVLHIQQFLQDGNNLTFIKERLLPIRYIESKLNPTIFVNSVTFIIPKEKIDFVQSKNDKDLLKIPSIYLPDNVITNINASSEALIKGNVDEAWAYLSIVKDKPEAYNNLGVYYWLKGNKYKAESYFRKAATIDDQADNANTNLKMLRRYVIR